jgi:hypothetical protein
MERLSIASFLQNGHPFHLYVYEDTEGIPPGAVLRDANEILSYSQIFTYPEYDTYAGFANFFRYKLLLERGGWWADTDTVCLRPFEFSTPFVFSSELASSAVPQVNVGVLKAPPQSAIFEEAWDFCRSVNPKNLVWGQCGTALMGTLVERHSLTQFVQPPVAFCPLHYPEWEMQLDPEASWLFGAETFAVHLWNEMWRRAGSDKNRRWDEQCLYERLKRRYLEPASEEQTPSGDGERVSHHRRADAAGLAKR